MSTIDKLKSHLIASEIARRNASDADTVQMILESLTTVDAEGAVVGIASEGSRPLSAMLDDLKRSNPNYFAPPAPTRASVILDPAAKGFSFTAAMVAARNDPVAYDALMARLAPTPLKVLS